MVRRRLQDPHTGTLLDDALVVFFPGPASFTGEDVVEVHCHGGPITVAGVLDALRARGARMAEAGAFTRRALLHGRMDLLQVEALADLIDADAPDAHALAQQQLRGDLSTRLQALREDWIHLMVLLEAAIDFSLEEHVYSLGHGEMVARIDPLIAGLDALLGTWDEGRLRREGIRVAIVGCPNAGKSSLLNHLAGHERSLVTEIAGTTRDWIEETVQVQGHRLVLVDTAGIRQTDDRVEALGVARARAQVEGADARMLVLDSRSPEAGLALVEPSWGSRPLVVVWNHADGAGACFAPARVEGAHHVRTCLAPPVDAGGLEEALGWLVEACGLVGAGGAGRGGSGAVLTRARHREAVEEARAALAVAREAARAGRDPELVALDVRAGLDALGRLTGAVTSEAVLARILEGFCIGK
jgi:tRNA modification GTPase